MSDPVELVLAYVEAAQRARTSASLDLCHGALKAR
jgi:hypothetical protein